MKQCHACRKELSIGRTVGRRDECPFCQADLRCCLNCAFYDRAAPKQCREPSALLVQDKERGNYCDYFTFAEARETRSDDGQARKALDDLFKK